VSGATLAAAAAEAAADAGAAVAGAAVAGAAVGAVVAPELQAPKTSPATATRAIRCRLVDTRLLLLLSAALSRGTLPNAPRRRALDPQPMIRPSRARRRAGSTSHGHTQHWGQMPGTSTGPHASPAGPRAYSAGAKPAVASGNGPGGTPANVRDQLVMQRPERGQLSSTLVTARQPPRGPWLAAPNVVEERDAIGLGFGHSSSYGTRSPSGLHSTDGATRDKTRLDPKTRSALQSRRAQSRRPPDTLGHSGHGI
jgi:hypothetical protein